MVGYDSGHHGNEQSERVYGCNRDCHHGCYHDDENDGVRDHDHYLVHFVNRV